MQKPTRALVRHWGRMQVSSGGRPSITQSHLLCPPIQVLYATGDSCPANSVCEIRDCFRSELLNYDNIFNALVMNLQLTTRNNIWRVSLEYEAAAGANVWWYFAFAMIAGSYISILMIVVIGNNYFNITRLFKDKLKGHENEVDHKNLEAGERGRVRLVGWLCGREWCGECAHVGPGAESVPKGQRAASNRS